MAELAKAIQTQQRQKSASRNKSALRCLVIPMRKRGETVKQEDPEPGHSKSVTEDPFTALSGHGDIIEPPFDLLTLAMLNEHNTELTPVVEAMETNIEGFGYHLRCRVDLKKLADDRKKEIKREHVWLTNFFNNANLRDSFTQLRRKLRRDLELTGNGYWEVIRNAAGKVQGFEHLPSYQVRLGRIEEQPFKIKVPVLELQADGSFEIAEIPSWQRFRRFVQSRLTPFRGMQASEGGYRLRWFKEFGDPRVYNNETGELVRTEEIANYKSSGKPIPEEKRANEVIHFKHYSARSPYGLPRFIGNLLSIFGARASEEINYITLRNNNIPSMFVLVSNGQLTEGTIGRLESFVESSIQGSDNYSKFLILEAEGVLEGEDAGNVKLEVKPLVSEQHKDALFQNYMKNNQQNIRRAFRLPPILVGSSADFTRATAETSRRLADEQVFAPERDEFDSFINRRLLPEMGARHHVFKSNSPNTTDNAELVRILSGAEKTGGMTPRIARDVLEDILGAELPPFPKDERFDPDLPFSLLMAEAVKNRADVTEPGQQVTALKSLLGWDEPELGDETLEKIEALRIKLEKLWEQRAQDGQ